MNYDEAYGFAVRGGGEGVEGKCGVRKGRGRRMMVAWACEAEDDSTEDAYCCLSRSPGL